MVDSVAWGWRGAIKQGLCITQSGYCKALWEQIADRSEKVMSRLLPIPTAPQASKAGSNVQFPKVRILLSRQGKSLVEAEFCFLLIRLALFQQQLAPNPMKLCFNPSAARLPDLG
jgi:hypothetical protein